MSWSNSSAIFCDNEACPDKAINVNTNVLVDQTKRPAVVTDQFRKSFEDNDKYEVKI